MDEMKVSTEDIDGQRNFCYDGKEVIIPDAWRKPERQNWPKDGCDGDQLGRNHMHLYRLKWSESER